MEFDWVKAITEIKKKPQEKWKEEIEKLPEGTSFPGCSDQTIKEKVAYELRMEWRRRRTWKR